MDVNLVHVKRAIESEIVQLRRMVHPAAEIPSLVAHVIAFCVSVVVAMLAYTLMFNYLTGKRLRPGILDPLLFSSVREPTRVITDANEWTVISRQLGSGSCKHFSFLERTFLSSDILFFPLCQCGDPIIVCSVYRS